MNTNPGSQSTSTPAPSQPSVNAVIDADAVIIGAGPVGLFQVFELGLLEIKAHVIDSLGAVGGQCVEPYAIHYHFTQIAQNSGRGITSI